LTFLWSHINMLLFSVKTPAEAARPEPRFDLLVVEFRDIMAKPFEAHPNQLPIH